MKIVRVNGRIYRLRPNIDTSHPASWKSCWIVREDCAIYSVHRSKKGAEEEARSLNGRSDKLPKVHVSTYYLKP